MEHFYLIRILKYINKKDSRMLSRKCELNIKSHNLNIMNIAEIGDEKDEEWTIHLARSPERIP